MLGYCFSVWFVFSSGTGWLSTHMRTKPLLAVSIRNQGFINHHGGNSSHRWGHVWAKGRPPKSFLDWSEMFWLLHTALLGILPLGMVVFLPCYCRGAMQGTLLIPDLVARLSPYVLLSLYGILGTLQCVPKSAVLKYWCPHWHDLQVFKSAGELKRVQNIPRPPLLSPATEWS